MYLKKNLNEIHKKHIQNITNMIKKMMKNAQG